VRFLLVDRIVELERGKRATGIKNVSMSEDFLADHFPEQPVMPGALIAESLVQLANWVVRESSEFRCVGLVSSFERLRFRQFVLPGDQLRLEVEIVSQDAAEVSVRGRAFRGDEIVTSAEFTLALHSAAELVTVADSAQLFSVMRPQRDGEVPGGD
jgi:3-hydroxyacyl-[acyl-carrier-protein] dehydratase